MSLSFGSRLEPYEITGSLGAGGMGEVYRAIDTNLKRQVAIKVLPPSMTDDADRLSRFQREAEVARQKTTDIWVYDVDGSAIMRLTSDGQSTTPAWASDGVRLAYSSFGKGPARLFTRNADGSGSPQPLSEGTIRFAYGWFDRSTKLIFAELRDGGLDVGIVDTANGSRYRALLTSPANETRPDVSPDGRWLAYTSNELSNRDEIYVRPMADQESGKWQVSTDGGHSPIWVSGGRELVYRAPGRMMSVTIRPGETFRFDAPRSIFPDSYANDKADAATTWQLTAASSGSATKAMRPTKST